MVKRTVVVLGILSLMLAATTPSFAFLSGWPSECGVSAPLYVPAPCCPYPEAKTIVKTWHVKIVGPCPPPAAACGSSCNDGPRATGVVSSLANLAGLPFDVLFNHWDSVYGCTSMGGSCGKGGCPCCLGPLPMVLGAVPMALGAPTTFAGTLW